MTVDADGHYSLLLGSSRNEGVPVELFASGEPRWLGVQFQRAGDRGPPVIRLADHVDVGLRSEDHAEAAAHQRLVVGDDGADHSGNRASTAKPPPGRGPASRVPP